MVSHRKTMALLLALSITSSIFITPAFALETGFNDTSNSPYREQIHSLQQYGIVNGIGNNNFAPSQIMDQGQLIIMCARYLNQDNLNRILDSIEDYGEKTYNVAKSMWTMGYDDYSSTLYNPITLNMAAKLLFQVAKLPVYGNEMYTGVHDENYSSHDGYDQLVRLNIISEENFKPDQLVTRELAAYLMYNILYSDIDIVQPDIFTSSNIDVIEVCTDLYKLFNYINKVPEEVTNKFIQDGWRIVVGTEYINKWEQDNNIQATALCSYANKTIYLKNSKSVCHEFGHYLNYALNFPKHIDDLYNSEKEALSKLTGSYCKTNSSEFFAELFEYYVMYKNNMTELAKLRVYAPLSYSYIVELENNGWITIK